MRKMTANEINESLKKLVKEEIRISVHVLDHLMIINEKKLYLKYGYESLLKYCVKELKYSEAAAYRRIKAMRLVSEVKGAREKLLSQKVNLTQLSRAQSIFEEARKEEKKEIGVDKKLELLGLIENKSTFDSENILRNELELPEKRRIVRVDVSEDVYQNWIRLKGRIAHKNFTGSGVLDFAIQCAIKELNAEFVKPKKRNSAKPLNEMNRHVPIRLRQRLLKEANYKCSYPTCGSSYALEIDHIKPVKLGGKTTEDNLRVLCRNHNQYMNEISG